MSIQTKLTPVRRATALVGGAFAVTLALAACGGGSDTPDGAVENFLDNGIESIVNDIAAGEFESGIDTAGDYFCADDVASLQDMADMFADMSAEDREMALGSMSDEMTIPEDWSYEIGETTEEEDTATVEVSMTESGETTDETFDLVKEEDEWKICGEF
ncbi:DUF4878 domain-containing protein [Glycomyces sp. L485]|uniref:DUF4878 domain-containing protein n=1 Tax=Glycomyces sp. L485 TaxID=2909235 RepID=UPI001F4AF759|nr:DUF4878 domain-containing protein [Glycomyces sp. L485]MCH7231998.1 DUF4878 domain-containing protein [Glycomyces sp. L485]